MTITDADRAAACDALANERVRVAALVDAYWVFRDGQQPYASWHEKQACLEAVRSGDIPLERLVALRSRKAIIKAQSETVDAIAGFIAEARQAAVAAREKEIVGVIETSLQDWKRECKSAAQGSTWEHVSSEVWTVMSELLEKIKTPSEGA